MKNTMIALALFAFISTVLIVLPIAYYIQYWVLSQLSAPTHVWLLFWVQIPVMLLIQIVAAVIKANSEN